ncbi:unnamed protein product [Caenorhabditis auriculariae]|uniref:Protein kinase domain-containing protein n=1 Tax=Caenorhabditis auriculariae TaxID=2777116 RepID=A0A8S1HGW0_9PELO|nr:unnamed protein product [Caenorhabditis auriculariae]
MREKVEEDADQKSRANPSIEFEKGCIFLDKWLIIRKLDKKNSEGLLKYMVADKEMKVFGTLWIEKDFAESGNLAFIIDFLRKQDIQGNASFFLTIIDSGLLNEDVMFMVTVERPGPTLEQCLSCSRNMKKNDILTPKCLSIVALDILQIIEVIASSGYSLRNISLQKWRMDTRTRKFYLWDLTDIAYLYDRRFVNGKFQNTELFWTGTINFAPIAFHNKGIEHRMSELDMIESLYYFMFQYGLGELPWESCKEDEKLLAQKESCIRYGPVQKLSYSKNDEITDEQMLEIVLQNICDFIKQSALLLEKLKNVPARDGYYLPNGYRAGALVTPVPYESMYHILRSLAQSAYQKHYSNFRDIVFDWEVQMEETDHNKSIVKYLEIKRKYALAEAQRKILNARKAHYAVIIQQQRAERKIAEIEVKRYLGETEPVGEKERSSKTPVKKAEKRRRGRPITRVSKKEERNSDSCPEQPALAANKTRKKYVSKRPRRSTASANK